MRIVKFMKIGAACIAAFFAFGWVVMLLWNAVLPPATGWHTITYGQALGLLVLSKILFGGCRGGPRADRRWRRRMFERWEQMTPEERERFREGMRSRCGHGHADETQHAQ